MSDETPSSEVGKHIDALVGLLEWLGELAERERKADEQEAFAAQIEKHVQDELQRPPRPEIAAAVEAALAAADWSPPVSEELWQEDDLLQAEREVERLWREWHRLSDGVESKLWAQLDTAYFLRHDAQ